MLATIGAVFGAIAAMSAYIITFREYRRHKMPRGRLIRHSLSSAAIAFGFFLLAAILVGLGVMELR